MYRHHETRIKLLPQGDTAMSFGLYIFRCRTRTLLGILSHKSMAINKDGASMLIQSLDRSDEQDGYQIIRGFLCQIILSCVLLGGLLTTQVNAKAHRSTNSDSQNQHEFVRLYESLQITDDPDQKIAALEAALRIEPKLVKWPLSTPRKEVKANLLRSLRSEERRVGE